MKDKNTEEFERFLRGFRRRVTLYQELGWLLQNPYFEDDGDKDDDQGETPSEGRLIS